MLKDFLVQKLKFRRKIFWRENSNISGITKCFGVKVQIFLTFEIEHYFGQILGQARICVRIHTLPDSTVVT